MKAARASRSRSWELRTSGSRTTLQDSVQVLQAPYIVPVTFTLTFVGDASGAR